MPKKSQILDSLQQQATLSMADFPDIDLYMDQVLTCLARTQLSQRETEKLSSAMVNNYIKDGLLPRANGKKYSAEHLAYLTMISKLKQVLSVKDLGTLLKSELAGSDIETRFGEFADVMRYAIGRVSEDIESDPAESAAHTALKLAVLSYLAKSACEFLLDDLSAEQKQSEEAAKQKAKSAAAKPGATKKEP